MKFALAISLGLVLSPFLAIAAEPSAPTPPERQNQSANLTDEWRAAFENLLDQGNLTKEQEKTVGQALNMSNGNIFDIDGLAKYQATTGQAVHTLMNDLRQNFSQDQYIALMQDLPNTQKFLMSANVQFDPVCNCDGYNDCGFTTRCIQMTCIRPVGSELNGVCH